MWGFCVADSSIQFQPPQSAGRQSTTQAMVICMSPSPLTIHTINILLSLLVLLLPLVLLHLGDEEHLAVLLALLPLRQQRLPRLELHLGRKYKSGLLVETNIAAERPADVYSNKTQEHTPIQTHKAPDVPEVCILRSPHSGPSAGRAQHTLQRYSGVFMFFLGTGSITKTDDFSGKFQKAFDPPPPSLIFGKSCCNFFFL